MGRETGNVIPLHAGIDAPEGSEDAIAEIFADYCCEEARFVAAWGKWLRWANNRWKVDSTLATFDEVRMFVRAQADREQDRKTGRSIASAKTVAAVERLARSDRRLCSEPEMWDSDPLLLGTPTGTVDLRNGMLTPARPEHYISKLTSVGPAPDHSSHPVWDAYLNDVTGGDADYLQYLQRIAGYCLTGLTKEHALFFLYGTGRNGKGVFTGTIHGILGEYSEVSSMDTFIDTGLDRHPTDLAKLRGARLVTAQETERGRAFAEARIKSLTGGDPISARFMRQDFFTYTPQFKLVIVGNHLPALANVDEAMRSRLHILPFTKTIPEARRDKGLHEKLRQEWPAILRWAIDGCLAWQELGLAPPSTVRAATQQYFTDEDIFALWLNECCVRDKASHTASSDLFQSWTEWLSVRGEKKESNKAFAQRLKGSGVGTERMSTGRSGYVGIRLRSSQDNSEGSDA